MTNAGHQDTEQIIARLQQQASSDEIRLTLHGHKEMVEEEIFYKDVCEVLINCQVIENYPDHQRGPCCLICGRTYGGRFLHVVCTTSLDVIIIITVYEPQPPKWVTPFERGGRHEV